MAARHGRPTNDRLSPGSRQHRLLPSAARAAVRSNQQESAAVCDECQFERSQQRRNSMRKGFGIAFGATLGLAMVFVIARLLGGGGPQVIDRGTVIGKLTEHTEFLAATKTYRPKFDVKNECQLPVVHATLPGVICGTTATFEVDGSVAATVDLSGLRRDGMTIDSERNVTVNLP